MEKDGVRVRILPRGGSSTAPPQVAGLVAADVRPESLAVKVGTFELRCNDPRPDGGPNRPVCFQDCEILLDGKPVYARSVTIRGKVGNLFTIELEYEPDFE